MVQGRDHQHGACIVYIAKNTMIAIDMIQIKDRACERLFLKKERGLCDKFKKSMKNPLGLHAHHVTSKIQNKLAIWALEPNFSDIPTNHHNKILAPIFDYQTCILWYQRRLESITYGRSYKNPEISNLMESALDITELVYYKETQN